MGRIQIQHLEHSRYIPCGTSPTFPFVTTSIINQFLQQAEGQDGTTFIRTSRQWIRDHLESESCPFATAQELEEAAPSKGAFPE